MASFHSTTLELSELLTAKVFKGTLDGNVLHFTHITFYTYFTQLKTSNESTKAAFNQMWQLYSKHPSVASSVMAVSKMTCKQESSVHASSHPVTCPRKPELRLKKENGR